MESDDLKLEIQTLLKKYNLQPQKFRGQNFLINKKVLENIVELTNIKKANMEQYLILARGRIQAQRCQAQSKRHGKQCDSPTIKGKRVCRLHGGPCRSPTI